MSTTITPLFPKAKLQLTVFAVALMAFHSTASLASDIPQPSAAALDKQTAVVSLADLDISTPQGAKAARERLRETARRLCYHLEDSQDLGHQPHFVACVEAALAGALRQLEAPAAAAVDGARSAEHTTP